MRKGCACALVLPDTFVCKVNEKFIDEMAALAASKKDVPKRLRKMEGAFEFNENKKMRQVDYEGHLRRQPESPLAGSAHQCPDGKCFRPSSALESLEGNKLCTGQAVHHWWASWFKDATEPKIQIKKKGRPQWYDAQIIAALGVKKMMYAGQEFEEHTYQVH